MADTQTPSTEKMEAVLTKLAEFHNTLPSNEQEMLLSLVASATGETEGEGGTATPSREEQVTFAKKLESYRDTLPEEERILVDGIMVAAGAVEEEVTGHAWYQAWSTSAGLGWYAYLKGLCFGRSGTQYFSYSPNWWYGGLLGTYRCYDWR